jgi:antitoxin HicB
MNYPVKLVRDSNDAILVDFPDVPEAHTFGEDMEEALMRAGEALESALSAYIELRRDIPAPSKPKRGQPVVSLPALVDAKVRLYSAMRASRIGKAELARRLNCHLPQIDRLLDLNHNSRLDQLEAALRALGKRLVVSVVDAA